MTELRWILLGAGIALVLGLWWWESRRTDPEAEPQDPWPRPRAEPRLDADQPDARPAAAAGPTAGERLRAGRRPPMIEIPDDAEVDISEFVDRRGSRPPAAVLPAIHEEPPAEPAAAVANPEIFEAVPDADHRETWVRTQPLERDEVAPQQDKPKGDIEQRSGQAAAQRVVALRLAATSGRWNGADLRAALDAEGLHYGRYSIFHREREDGKSLFYVASMMEPGSFELATMDQESYPGISMFSVVPGAIEAPSLFDMMLATARRLAERLKGQLQDEQGSTLTTQRILNMREELVHLEHRNRRLRRQS